MANTMKKNYKFVMLNYIFKYSVQLSYSVLSDSVNPWIAAWSFLVQHQLPELAQTHVHRVSDVIQASQPLSSPSTSCLQSFPTSGSFPMSQLFALRGQSIGASASASVFAVNSQDWVPLGLIGLISLQSKRFSGVFSNTTVQKHQFFSTQLSLWSEFHIHTRLLEKP